MDKYIDIEITEKYTQQKRVLKSTIAVYQGLASLLDEFKYIEPNSESGYELHLDLENPVLRMDLRNLVWFQPVTKMNVDISQYRDSSIYNNLEQKAYQVALDTFQYERYIELFGYIIPDNYDVIYLYKSADSKILIFIFIKREKFIEQHGKTFYDEFFSGIAAVTYFPFTKGTLKEFRPFNHGVLPFDPFSEDSENSQ